MAIEDIYLAQFNRCRDEIDNRTDISEKLVLAQIAALGSGIAVLEKTPDVLLGLSIVSSFLWLFWTAHTNSISQLAGFIALELFPKLRALPGHERLIGWEEYRLVGSSSGAKVQKPRKLKLLNAAHWKLWLFVGSAPVLLLVYGFVLYSKWSVLMRPVAIVTIVRAIMMFFSCIIFGFALHQHFAVKKIWEDIDDRVETSFKSEMKKRPGHV